MSLAVYAQLLHNVHKRSKGNKLIAPLPERLLTHFFRKLFYVFIVVLLIFRKILYGICGAICIVNFKKP